MSDVVLKDLSYKKSVALMQPTFLPWLGYFGLMSDVDEFVFLDDFQFVRRSFHHRNKIFISKEKADFISIPIEHKGDQTIALNQINRQIDPKWNKKFLKTLQHNYGSLDYFKEYYDFIENWLNKDFESLAEFNIYFIRYVAEKLGIHIKLSLSSPFNITGSRSERLLKILEASHADLYLSALGSFDYMQEDRVFPEQNIRYIFQNYQPSLYPQSNTKDFVSHLSVLDCLFEHGAEETKKIIDKPSGIYYSVKELERQRND